MTSTRESMRRELKELAKLADGIRKDQDSANRPSGEWSTVPLPSAESLGVPSPEPETPTDAPPTVSAVRPVATALLTPPSSPSVPPGVESFGPVASPARERDSELPARKRSPVFAAMAAVAAAGVLVLSGTVGRSLYGTPSAGHPAAEESPTIGPSTDGAGANANAAIGLASGAVRSAEDPSAAANGPEPAASAAPGATQTAEPQPVGAAHGSTAQPPTSAGAAGPRHKTPAPAAHAVHSPAAKPDVPANKPAGADSLDDLIRRAVQTGSK